MNQGNAALQWILDTDDDHLSEFFDDDFAIDELSAELTDELQDGQPGQAHNKPMPEWLRNEFEYDMQAFDD